MNTGPQATSLTGRLLALLLRPIFIFFDLTLVGYLLLRNGPGDLGPLDGPAGSPLSSARPGDGYFDWLTSLFPLDEALTTSLEFTLQLLVAACLVALVVGAIFGAVTRSGAVGRALGGLSIPMLSLAGPILGLTLIYWFVIRFDVGPALGASRLGESPGNAIRQLVLPALTVGLPMAPAVGTIIGRRDPYAEPYGVAAAGAMLASRSEARRGWRFGFPAGLLVVGVLTAEATFARPGLVNLLLNGLLTRDDFLVLDVLALFAFGGAALAIAIDLIGLRPHYPTSQTTAGLRLAGYSTKPPSKLLLGTATVLVIGLVALAAWGSSRSAPELDLASRAQGPFTAGHLLGTDGLGRDLLQLAAASVGEGIMFALIPSLAASILGIGLAAAQDRLGTIGQVVPGTVIDALWWPLPILAMLASLTFADPDNPYLHPAVLGLMALGLTPTALRMLRRDPLHFDAGSLTRMAGTWFMVASTCFLAYLSASFLIGFSEAPALGAQMRNGLSTMSLSVWASAVPALFATAILLALNGVGAGLIHLGWHRSAKRLTDELDAEADEVPIRMQNQPPLYDEAAPVVAVGAYTDAKFADQEYADHGFADQQFTNQQFTNQQFTDDEYAEEEFADEYLADDPDGYESGDYETDGYESNADSGSDPVFDRSRLGPWRYSDDNDDGPLTPNYGLQPGLPRIDPNDETITLDDLPTIPPPPLPAKRRRVIEPPS